MPEDQIEEVPAPTEVADEPAPVSSPLTADEIEERAYKATQRALAEASASPGTSPEPVSNPQVDALDALDLRTDMYEEALEMHPDMPAEARNQLKSDLRGFKTIQALRAAKDSKLHIKLADAAAGESLRAGKYVPERVRKAIGVTREPVHTGVQAAEEIPREFRDSMAEVARDMGFAWTEAEVLAEWKRESAR